MLPGGSKRILGVVGKTGGEEYHDSDTSKDKYPLRTEAHTGVQFAAQSPRYPLSGW